MGNNLARAICRIFAFLAITFSGSLFASNVESPVNHPQLLRVSTATAEMQADDAMVVGGGIGPGKLTGQEGMLQATAIVLDDGRMKLCLVACDVLMMNRDLLDEAARRIERDCGIPFANILINSSHTHHAPTTVTIHGYGRDETFSRRTVEAIVAAARRANEELKSAK